MSEREGRTPDDLARYVKRDAAGNFHWGREYVPFAEWVRRYEECLERGRRDKREYVVRLVKLYGEIPAWAPAWTRTICLE